MKIRRIHGLILCMALLVMTSFSPVFAAIPEPTESFYVNDFAGVLSDSTKEHIIDKNIEIENRTGAQIVVVTVDFTDGADIQDYGADLFNEWRIGSAEQNNGVLLLLSIGDDDYYILQGRGLERVITGGTLDLIFDDYLEPYFAVQDYDSGVLNTFDELFRIVDTHYVGSVGNVGNEGSTTETTPASTSGGLSLIILCFIISRIVRGPARRRRESYGTPMPSNTYHRRKGHRPPPPQDPYYHDHHDHQGQVPTHGSVSSPKPRSKPSAPPPSPSSSKSGGLFGGGGGSSRGGGASRSSSSSSSWSSSSPSRSSSPSPSSGGHSGGGGSSRGGGASRSGGGGSSGGSGGGRRK